MYLDVKKRKLISFASLVFSSLGFTSGILLIRLFSEHESLAQVINLQSIVVFSSFILQFGLRAAVRGHIYNRRVRLARLSEKSLHHILALCSIFVFLIEYLYGLYFYFCLSSLLALVTLRLTINVAESSVLSILKFSLINFCVAIAGSVFILISTKIEYANLSVEFVALFLVVATVKLKDWGACFKYRASLYRIYFEAQSFQLGSCVIALFMFLLSQAALVQFSSSNELSAYSDALVFSGFLVLLLGKLMLLFEKGLYQNSRKHLLYISIILASQVLVAVSSSLLIAQWNKVSFLTVFVIVFILLSRVIIGYIVQYLSRGRRILNFITGFLCMIYIFVYTFALESVHIFYHLVPIVFFIMIGILLFKYNDRAL